nr:MAG TPA: hypothetical protein [Caudoviricetes sp.]
MTSYKHKTKSSFVRYALFNMLYIFIIPQKRGDFNPS